jgi:hypothetical protein
MAVVGVSASLYTISLSTLITTMVVVSVTSERSRGVSAVVAVGRVNRFLGCRGLSGFGGALSVVSGVLFVSSLLSDDFSLPLDCRPVVLPLKSFFGCRVRSTAEAVLVSASMSAVVMLGE